MEPRRIIRTDIAASAIAHLTLVALIIVISEVHPFHPPPIETVSVEIVTPDELKEKAPEPTPAPQTPLPDLSASKQDAAPPAAPPSSQPTPPSQPSPPQQASPSQQQPRQTPNRREANAQAQQQTTPPQAQTAPPQAPVYKPPEPDVTVKYGVMLGLPEALPPLAEDNPKDRKEDDGGDAKDSVSAKLPPNVVTELRRHLKSCAKLPASIAPSDNVRIKLRAVMTTEGMLARPPILIEASASAKGPILMQSAKSALEACQPYSMLPADKYEEWKVLDLTFTPRDFSGS